jgi:hypothetical protein
MPNPLEDEMWKDIREAYDIVASGQADNLEVDSPIHAIKVFKNDFGEAIYIKVVM